ncbi:hypothetical protein TSAR_010762, partial [Trichomalopsis sarcophagae]
RKITKEPIPSRNSHAFEPPSQNRIYHPCGTCQNVITSVWRTRATDEIWVNGLLRLTKLRYCGSSQLREREGEEDSCSDGNSQRADATVAACQLSLSVIWMNAAGYLKNSDVRFDETRGAESIFKLPESERSCAFQTCFLRELGLINKDNSFNVNDLLESDIPETCNAESIDTLEKTCEAVKCLMDLLHESDFNTQPNVTD